MRLRFERRCAARLEADQHRRTMRCDLRAGHPGPHIAHPTYFGGFRWATVPVKHAPPPLPPPRRFL